ncbi:MAG: NERD domain-containing protein, partial [Gammaproteobacteria bacterium]
PIVYQVYSVLWVLIPIAIVIGIFKSPWFKGLMGEFWVNLVIRLTLSNADYHLLTNITLPAENGTTQIDHIIVSRYGIFVIETKNMRGWIYGTAQQKQWTQKIFRHTSRFQNPLHQNYKHVKALETLLNLSPDMIFSIVVFAGNSTFKTPMPSNVTYVGSCIRYVKAQQQVLLSDPEVADIVNYIEARRFAKGLKTNREHVAHVRQIIAEKDNSKSCSKCGSIMKIRKMKKGPNAGNKFWGCSAYPRCKNIESIQ